MSILILLLVIAALICFVIAAFGVAFGRVNFIGLGLAFWALTVLLTQLGVR